MAHSFSRNAFLVIDKPAGLTSQQVVGRVKRWLDCRRVGHTGTLDPLATGVLPLAFNRATRLIQFLDEGRKVYSGEIELGVTSDTLDRDGQVTSVRALPADLDAVALDSAMQEFVGRCRQQVPDFSAVKKDGRPLYAYARAGVTVAAPSREIEIRGFSLLAWQPPRLSFRVECSRGTYVRSLAADLGEKLGCGGRIWSLRREASGPFELDQALTLEDLQEILQSERELPLLSPLEALRHLPRLRLNDQQAAGVGDGVCPRLAPEQYQELPDGRLLMLDQRERLLAVAELERGTLRLLRVTGGT